MKFFVAAALALSSALFASPVNADCCKPEDHRTITKLDLYESTVVTNELHIDHGELRYNSESNYNTSLSSLFHNLSILTQNTILLA